MTLNDLSYRQILDTAPDAIVVVDARGNIVLVNLQAECLFGYSRSELVGETLDTLLPERFRKQHQRHRQLFFLEPRIRAIGRDEQFLGRRKDGSEFPVEIGLSPVVTAEGLLVSSSIRDVTPRRNTGAALEQAKELAESASLSESRFLAAACHDLRQPMQSVGMYLSVLDGQLDRADARETSGKIRRSLAAMGELLDGLRDTSMLNSEAIEPAE